MTKPPHYWKKAKNYLSSKDKVMKNLIKRYDDTTLSTRKDVFYSLCKSIIGQQISVAAANSVYKKFNTACKGKICLLYTSPSPRDLSTSRMPSSA